MKYAALIFGDENRQPKRATGKSSPEPGQIVRNIDGSVYRVASKYAGPDGFVVRLANLQGKPVQTPPNFRPVGLAMARLASWLHYRLAYRKDFNLYINSYIERHNQESAARAAELRKQLEKATDPVQQKTLKKELKNAEASQLPYPVGRDGKAYDWAKWLQGLSNKYYIEGHGDTEDKQEIKDELIHEMLFTVLGQRRVLDQFVSKAKELGVTKENAAVKLRDFLISAFTYASKREMFEKFQRLQPAEEISMWQPGEEGEEVNILEQEEHGISEEEFQSAEARRDIARFREAFRNWLLKPAIAGQKQGENFILMFDIFWRLLQNVENPEDIKRNDLQDEWIEKTGLSYGSFKDYFMRLPELVEQFITSHGTELGDKNIFIDLMNTIRAERDKRERKEKEKERRRVRPAMAVPAMASLKIAEGIEEDIMEARENVVSPLKEASGVGGDFAEALSNSENPDVVDPDIAQPTESAAEAAKVGKRGSARRYSKTAETIETQKGAFSYEAGDVVNPDDFIPQGSYNPHNVRPWLIHNEFGTLAIVYADNEQDALDEAVDAGKLDSCRIPDEEIGDYGRTEGVFQPDSEVLEAANATLLGNASEPFDLTYIGMVPLPNKQYGVSEVETDEMLEGMEKDIIKDQDEQFLRDLKIKGSKKAQLLRGDQLTPEQRNAVINGFPWRWTKENPKRTEHYHCDKCDLVNNPYVSETSDGHLHPTVPLMSDEDWIKGFAFNFTNDGRLKHPQHALPLYLAQERVASVDQKFALEKAAYNPGTAEYIYKADVYCEPCAKKMIKKLWGTVNDQGDSDTFPQGPYYDQEADAPQHCAKCGRFLENPLTADGYRYLNQMILEHEADGKGQSDIIDEWKAFYPEREQEEYRAGREIDDALKAIERDTDKDFLRSMRTSKKAMIPHEFNDADGQAVRPETWADTDYVSGEADTTEFRERNRMAAEVKTAAITVSQGEDAQGFHMNINMNGREYVLRGQDAENFRREYAAIPKPEGKVNALVEKYLNVLQPYGAKPKPAPQAPPKQKSKKLRDWGIPSWLRKKQEQEVHASKTAQGSGGTTVTMQEQNVTSPNVPGKGQPMAVPEAIDQTAGPHSPNAPMTAPRTPGIQPKIVNVPPGTEGEDAMSNMASAKNADYLEDPDPEIENVPECPRCHGFNIDIDATEDGYSIFCEDCEQVTYEGRLDPALGHGGSMHAVEPELMSDEPEPPEEMPFDEHEAADDDDIYRELEEEGRQDKELSEEIARRGQPQAPAFDANSNEVPDKYWEVWSQEQKEAWLVAHGWVKDDSWHGATWWMQKPMWSRNNYEESIPYQDTDDAINEELELMEKVAEREQKTSALAGEGRMAGRLIVVLAEDWFIYAVDPKTNLMFVFNTEMWHEWGNIPNALGEDPSKPQPTVEAMIPYARRYAPERLMNDNGKQMTLDEFKAGMPESMKTGAGSNSGNDDDRGAGDLWREQFYEHRTEGLSTDGMLSGMKEGAAVPVAPSVAANPNVQQNMNIVRPQTMQQAPGTMVGIMPGGGEEEGTMERKTIEPELPNAKYHMGMLAGEEEDRLLREDPEYKLWLEELAKTPTEGQPLWCYECGKQDDTVEMVTFEELGNAAGTGPLTLPLCKDCELEIAQDI